MSWNLYTWLYCNLFALHLCQKINNLLIKLIRNSQAKNANFNNILYFIQVDVINILHIFNLEFKLSNQIVFFVHFLYIFFNMKLHFLYILAIYVVKNTIFNVGIVFESYFLEFVYNSIVVVLHFNIKVFQTQ